MSDDKEKKCEVCGKKGECIEVPTYEVEMLEYNVVEGKRGVVTKKITIEQLNSLGWPCFVHTDCPDELRDGILAAILSYQYGKKSIDREKKRLTMIRENMEKGMVADDKGTRH